MTVPDSPDVPLPEPAPCAQETIPRLRVAFQGELGAFSEEALHTLWGDDVEPVPAATFEDVMDATAAGRTDYGILPVESTLVGGLDVTYDLLSLHDELCLVAEVAVPVHLCLLALPGATVADVRTIASHPVMLGQCSYFLERHRAIVPQPSWDTAGAAREVAESGDPTRAAAGTQRAAQRFGLEVLVEHIEDRPDSQMRFLAVAREPAPPAAGVPARTAVLCVLPESPGALVAALQPTADAGLNISHLVSRPTREPWRYRFFLEIEHEAGDARLPAVLAGVRRACAEYRYLGTYPRWHIPAPRRGGLLPW